jgi:prevent-host-death family protein
MTKLSSYNMHEAKTHLSQLVERALAGEDVVIARHGEALVRLVPVRPQRVLGLSAIALSPAAIAESLRPLDEDELALWEQP